MKCGTGMKTYRPMEQNRESRNKPSHLWSNDVDKGAKTIQWGKGQPFYK